MVVVNYSELLEAYEFVSFGAPMEHQAFISLDTGKIYWVSSVSEVEDELPEDLGESDRYIEVPHKHDLDLGARLALRFADEKAPALYDRVDEFFHRRRAYARFKDLLTRVGLLDQWYSFEAECTERALKDWCAANQIEIRTEGPSV